MMKRLFLLFAFFGGLQLVAQDFRFEARFYLLQDYIRQNAIKTVSLGRSADSIAAWKVSGLVLAFDELGRLTLVEEPLSENRKRHVVYTYSDQSRMYAAKQYYIGNGADMEPIQKWEILSDESQAETRELLTVNEPNADDTLRKNLIRFDHQQRIIFRESCPDRGNNIYIKMQYNASGLISGMSHCYSLSPNPDSCFSEEISHFSYDAGNRVCKITTFADDSTRLTRKISFYYSEMGSVFVADSSTYKASTFENYKFVVRYHGRVDFHTILFDKAGLVSVIKEINSYSKSASYLTFAYTFYDDPRLRVSSANNQAEFLLYYFAPIDWKKMY